VLYSLHCIREREINVSFSWIWKEQWNLFNITVRHLLPLAQVVINVPDRVAVLTSHPRNDDVIGAVPWKHMNELQQLVVIWPSGTLPKSFSPKWRKIRNERCAVSSLKPHKHRRICYQSLLATWFSMFTSRSRTYLEITTSFENGLWKGATDY